MVRKSILDKFTRLGGYEIVVRTLDGQWKNTSEASRKTGIPRQTIYRLLREHPESHVKHLLLSQENHERIKESCSQIKDSVKALERVQKSLESSLVVDLKELQARYYLQGEKSLEGFQLALRKQVEASEKQESTIEKSFRDALIALNSAVIMLDSAIRQVQGP